MLLIFFPLVSNCRPTMKNSDVKNVNNLKRGLWKNTWPSLYDTKIPRNYNYWPINEKQKTVVLGEYVLYYYY